VVLDDFTPRLVPLGVVFGHDEGLAVLAHDGPRLLAAARCSRAGAEEQEIRLASHEAASHHAHGHAEHQIDAGIVAVHAIPKLCHGARRRLGLAVSVKSSSSRRFSMKVFVASIEYRLARLIVSCVCFRTKSSSTAFNATI
jgi:hypothetical protein